MSAIQYINSSELTSSTTSVLFDNIPNYYNDLKIIITGRRNNTSTPNSYPYMRVNLDSGSNYSATHMYGFNGTTYSSIETNANAFSFHVSGLPSATEPYSTFIIDLMSYSSASVNKDFIGTMSCPQINSSNYVLGNSISVWRNTNPITSIELYAGGASWHTGSTFYLWGIK